MLENVIISQLPNLFIGTPRINYVILFCCWSFGCWR